MSYILDALKKAERERGIKQIPTLMTVHTPRRISPIRIWTGIGIVGVCATALVWYFIHSRQMVPSTLDPGSEKSELQLAAGAVTNTPSKPEDDSGAEPPGTEPAAARRPGAFSAQFDGVVAGMKDPEAAAPRNSVREQPLWSRSRVPIPDDADTPADIPDGDDSDEPPPQAVVRSIPRTPREPLAAERAAARPESLKEAVARMTLSLLMYSDSRDERMVYINGTKYKEGELVEGLYLLEDITEDGAILTYEGARALLQPK